MKLMIKGLFLSTLIAFGSLAIAQGEPSEVIVRSAGTGYSASGPAPEFAQLDRDGSGSIDHTEATGYKLLANDFRMADSNHDGHVSNREFERWTSMP